MPRDNITVDGSIRSKQHISKPISPSTLRTQSSSVRCNSDDDDELVTTLSSESLRCHYTQYHQEERGEDRRSNGRCSDSDIYNNISTSTLHESITQLKVSPPTTTVRRKKRHDFKRKKSSIISINMINCKYDILRIVVDKLGYVEVSDDDDWFLYWTDTSVSLERVMDMRSFQKINHFPGMSEITRKDNLARNLTRLWKLYPLEYNFFPRSWVLPADCGDFHAFYRQAKKKSRYLIVKPESGCQGKGIFITRNLKELKIGEHFVAQQYISQPLLLDGYKFDMRLYVLITSCDPLRVFLFNDGLARLATEPYCEPSGKNVSNSFIHLTNYSINKMNNNFTSNDESGFKRSVASVRAWLTTQGHDVEAIWAKIADAIIKTLISACPILSHNYRTCFPNCQNLGGSSCFEILGFDIMLDNKLTPWVIEVNHSPSFTCDSPLDTKIKESVLYDTLRLINLRAADKRRCVAIEKARVTSRLLQRRPPRVAEPAKQSAVELRTKTLAAKKAKEEEAAERERSAINEEADLCKWEARRCGGYTRIYPTGPECIERYASFLNSSSSLFAETVASKARQESVRMQKEELDKRKAIEAKGIIRRVAPLRRRKDEEVGEEGDVQTNYKRLQQANNVTTRLSTLLEDPVGPLPSPLPPTYLAMHIDLADERIRVGALAHRRQMLLAMGIAERAAEMIETVSDVKGSSTLVKLDQQHSPRAAPPACVRLASSIKYFGNSAPWLGHSRSHSASSNSLVGSVNHGNGISVYAFATPAASMVGVNSTQFSGYDSAAATRARLVAAQQKRRESWGGMLRLELPSDNALLVSSNASICAPRKSSPINGRSQCGSSSLGITASAIRSTLGVVPSKDDSSCSCFDNSNHL